MSLISYLHRSMSGQRGDGRRWLMSATAALLACGWVGSALAAEGAERLDRYLAGINSLKADFVQYTFNADRSKMMEAHGTLYLQRPGRFRWEYDSPTKQIIIADGQRVYLHDLELRQVSQQSQAKALRGTPALLLANRDPIADHFTTRAVPSQDGRDWVELTPREHDTEVVRIEVGLGQDTLDSLIMQDSFGQETRLNFSAAQRNPVLKPELFQIDRAAVDDFLDLD